MAAAVASAAAESLYMPVFRLPTVKSSPSTIQYAKHKLREKPYYTPAFSMTKDQWKKTLLAPWFRKTDPLMPVYPYGKNEHFPEANYGLYGGATLESGNKISKGRNKGKTLRKWFPNMRVEAIRSEALDRELTIPIRARVMRTIRKAGGLDEYVLKDRPARIKELGLLGWKLRWLVMTSPKMREKYAEERRKLGLPEKYSAIETFEEAWNDPERRQKMISEQEGAWEKLKTKMEKWDAHVENHWTTSDQKYAGLKEPYTREKENRPHTILNTTPSQIQLPDAIKEIPYERFEKLPKAVKEGGKSSERLEKEAEGWEDADFEHLSTGWTGEELQGWKDEGATKKDLGKLRSGKITEKQLREILMDRLDVNIASTPETDVDLLQKDPDGALGKAEKA